MKSKTIKNLTIATITILSASYIFQKYKNKKRNQPIINKDNNPNKETHEVVKERKYIHLHEINKNVLDEEILDFSSIPNRKYHTLDFSNQETMVSENEDIKEKKKAM